MATWLYAVRCTLPVLTWRARGEFDWMEDGPHSKEEADAMRADPDYVPRARLTAGERLGTPTAFRDLLVEMAKSVERSRLADAR